MVNMNMMGQMPGVQDTSEMAMQQASLDKLNYKPIQRFLSGATSRWHSIFKQGRSFVQPPGFSAMRAAIAPMASDNKLYASAAATPDPLNNE